MGDAGAHVGFEQPAVKGERGIELCKASIGLAGKPAAPKILVRYIAHSIIRLAVRIVPHFTAPRQNYGPPGLTWVHNKR